MQHEIHGTFPPTFGTSRSPTFGTSRSVPCFACATLMCQYILFRSSLPTLSILIRSGNKGSAIRANPPRCLSSAVPHTIPGIQAGATSDEDKMGIRDQRSPQATKGHDKSPALRFLTTYQQRPRRHLYYPELGYCAKQNKQYHGPTLEPNQQRNKRLGSTQPSLSLSIIREETTRTRPAKRHHNQRDTTRARRPIQGTKRGLDRRPNPRRRG